MLALVARNEEKFEVLLQKLKDDGVETEPLVIIADLTVDVERIISETIDKYGRLDILINNAGIVCAQSILDLKMDEFDSMMTVNFRAIVELTHLAVPHLIQTKGNVVNVSSITSTMAAEGLLGYCTSKV